MAPVDGLSCRQKTKVLFFRGGIKFQNGIYIIKTDSLGDTLWTKKYTASDQLNAYSIRQNRDNGYLLLGEKGPQINSTMYLMKTDSAGNKLWDKIWGNSSGFSMQITDDNEYFLLGTTWGPPNKILLVKTDSLGNQIWYKNYIVNNATTGYGMTLTQDGGLALLGYKIIQPCSGCALHTFLYLIKTDTAGNEHWNRTFSEMTNPYQKVEIQQTSDNGFILVGATWIHSLMFNDVYLVKTDMNGGVLTSYDDLIFSNNNLIKVYPNPFFAQTILQTDNFLYNATLTVDNCFGQTVKQIKNISGQTVILSCDNLPCGLYFLRLTEGNKIYTDKLVISDNSPGQENQEIRRWWKGR
ncbi:MAG: T9SS type A sorting domain-containing protein [Bacteroidetes bacterium]|nr:MAG: T9SS type A sorting domain-containing protein [Bacteroidota bacterium]